MKRINYLIIITLIITFSCSSIGHIIKNSPVEEINYGVLSSQQTIIDDDFDEKSPSGNTVLQRKLKVVKKTDTIEGKLGLIFGVNFIMNNEENISIPVKRVWTLPTKIEMPNGDIIQSVERTDIINTNVPMWMYYTVEYPNEIVKGKWTIQYFYKNKEIYIKDFFMK